MSIIAVKPLCHATHHPDQTAVLHLLLPQIHNLLPAIIALWAGIYGSQTLDALVELCGVLLAVKIKGNVAPPRRSHSLQTLRHGQVHPVLPQVGKYTALFAPGLKESGVGVGGEDEDGFEGIEGDECGDYGRW